MKLPKVINKGDISQSSPILANIIYRLDIIIHIEYRPIFSEYVS